MIPKFKYGGNLSQVAALILNELNRDQPNVLNRWPNLTDQQRLGYIATTRETVRHKFPNTAWNDQLVSKMAGQADAHFLDNPLPEHNAPEHRSQEHNPTAITNMSDRAVEFVTKVDGTDVKSLSKDQTIRAIKANLVTIKENTELNAQISSTTLAADIADRVAANEALKAHLETFAAPAAPATPAA